MHDYPVILCEPFLHFLLPSGMMDKTDGRDRRMAQYYMLYKPRGLLTAKRDARRETVMSCFPEALRETLHPVGRLDRDTEGLLLFTDDGMLDVRLLRPEQHVEKEYEYRAFGLLDETAMQQLEAAIGHAAPASLAALRSKPERFDTVIAPAQIAEVALGYQA
mgnify:CR=1 FL=1